MLTIARAEAFRTGGSFNKRTSAILLVIGLAMGFVVPHVSSGGLSFAKGLYRAWVEPGAPLLPAIEGSRLFRLVPDAADADVTVFADHVSAPPTSKGNAALAALKQAAKDYSYANLVLEKDSAAAFPVRVEVRYEPQQAAGAPLLVPPTAPIPTAGT